jgi:NAD(P)-dependent dehydrogenase (short-subunit alcohol dehydrogenase family)
MKIVLVGSSGGIGKAILEQIKDKNDIIEINSSNIDLSKNFEYKTEADALIYCAGINEVSHFKSLSEDNLNNTININTFGFVRMCKNLNFSTGANIIAIGSIYSTSTKAGRLSYSMSKHALHAAVKTLALEMCEQKIKVNLISPGFIDTSLTRKNNTKERIEFLHRNIPLGLTNATEIGKICKYFVNNNEHITGQNIIIDGGYSLVGI